MSDGAEDAAGPMSIGPLRGGFGSDFENRIRGQRAKLTRTVNRYLSGDHPLDLETARRLVREVMVWCDGAGITFAALAGDTGVPEALLSPDDDADDGAAAEQDACEPGAGCIYAWRFEMAPGVLKIARHMRSDPESVRSRIAAYLAQSRFPGGWELVAIHETHDPPAFERAIHAVLRLGGR